MIFSVTVTVTDRFRFRANVTQRDIPWHKRCGTLSTVNECYRYLRDKLNKHYRSLHRVFFIYI